MNLGGTLAPSRIFELSAAISLRRVHLPQPIASGSICATVSIAF